jgi:arsenate reductase
LRSEGYDVSTLRSKSWDEFSGVDAPKMDFIFTVCDRAAGESCPAWAGQPITAHWGFPDPAAVTGSHDEVFKAFANIEFQIATRIRLFLSLPIDKIDSLSLQKQLRELGSTGAGA